MSFYLLDDPEFQDFNFGSWYDPWLRPGMGPSRREVCRVVLAGRGGDRTARWEFWDVVRFTLRQKAYESFQQQCGTRPIEHVDWFYSKVFQYLALLLMESLMVQDPEGWRAPRTDRPWEEGELDILGPTLSIDEIEAAFAPDAQQDELWEGLVDIGLDREPEKLARFREAIAEDTSKPEPQPRVSRRPRGDSLVAERDRLIADSLRNGVPRERICAILDESGFPVTEPMRKLGAAKWLIAWQDSEIKPNVQVILSKAARRSGVANSE